MIDNLTTSLLQGTASSGSGGYIRDLFSKDGLNATGMQNLLRAAYSSETETDTVDLSSGLAEFIEANVKDESKKAALLADLDAIARFKGQSDELSGGAKLMDILLGNDDDSGNGLLNLLV